MSQTALVIFGTRPEAVKLAPVVTALRQQQAFEVSVCVTAQHRQMLDSVLHTFQLEPKHDLNLMRAGQTLEELTANAITALTHVIANEKPTVVIVQGDTTTTFVAALAAFYNRVPVAHVEAGLRTDDKYGPFPEEINRRLTTQIADIHFAPTRQAKENLLRDGVPSARILITGNTVIDALLYIAHKQQQKAENDRLQNHFRVIGLDPARRTILVTTHRRESFNGGIEQISLAVRDIANRYKDLQVLFPAHLNPNVQQPVRRILYGLPNVILVDPLSYEEFVYAMSHCLFIITDSGGVQEEAPSLRKPVLVVRDKTERPEGVDAGLVCLVGVDRARIVEQATAVMNNAAQWYKPDAPSPYGDGLAGQRIASALREHFPTTLAAGVR